MSGFTSNAPQQVTPLIRPGNRFIQGIVLPDCAIEEIGRDELEITEHPVEQGSTITDHAYKRPREVTLRWAWTNTGRSETFVIEVYNSLLALQASRAPFTLSTGKSNYTNMLLASIQQTTDATAEYALKLVAICREIIIVSTSTVSAPTQEAQAAPKSTAPTKSTGAAHPIKKPATFGKNITPQTVLPASAVPPT